MIDRPVDEVRACVRANFEKNRHASDLGTINILLFKGRAEYQEIMNHWAVEGTVLDYLDREEQTQDTQGLYGQVLRQFTIGVAKENVAGTGLDLLGNKHLFIHTVTSKTDPMNVSSYKIHHLLEKKTSKDAGRTRPSVLI